MLHKVQTLDMQHFSGGVLVVSSVIFFLLCNSRHSANADAKEMKEGKEKINDKDGKEAELRSVSVLSSLSYRKRSNLKDSIGGTGDDSSLFNTLKEQPDVPDRASIRTSKSKSGELQEDRRQNWSQEDLDDKDSVISVAYSEATSRARKGLESRWTSRSSPEFDKESMVSSVAPSRASTRRSVMDMDDDNKSTISSVSRSSPRSLHRSTSWKDERRSSSRLSLARSCGLSEYGLHVDDDDDDDDDGKSVGFSRGRASPYSPRSLSRSCSTPAQPRSSDNNPADTSDIKLVTHRNYLDPDLEAAINEVLSFKPIKFKRSKLDESSDEEEGEKMKQASEDSKKKVETDGLGCSTSNLLRSSSGSALDHSNRPSSISSSRSCIDKKGQVSSSESSSSSDDRRSRKSSKKKGKKSKKNSKRKPSESEDSSSSSESSSSSNSAISYRSSSSIKKCPKRVSDDEEEEELTGRGQSSKKETKKKKKKMDNLVMKYLYKPDSD